MNELNLGALVACLLTAGATLSPAAFGQDTIRLTIASSHPTTVPWVGVMSSHVVPESNRRLEAIGSASRIDWTESYGGTLYKFDATLEAVEERLTDLGWVGTLWEEAKMPLQNVTFHTPFVSDDVGLVLGVINTLHAELPALREAWKDQEQVFLGASGIDTYHILTKSKLERFDQLQGKKIIAAGAVGNWLRGTGAVPIDAGLPDFYNLLKTGVADGVLIGYSGAAQFKLYEVAQHVTKVGIGAQMTGGLTINEDTWEDLPDDVQEVLRRLGEEYSRRQAEILAAKQAEWERQMAAAGATVATLPDAERRKWVEALPDLAAEWRAASLERGAAADEVLVAYMQSIRKAGAQPLRTWGQ